MTSEEFFERTFDALDSFMDDDQNWREKWRDVFRSIHENPDILKEEVPLQFKIMLGMVAGAFADSADGTDNPLFTKVKAKGRPKLNKAEAMRRRLLGCVAAYALGGSKEETQRQRLEVGVEALRRAGVKANWTELRSAWGNRYRYDRGDFKIIDRCFEHASSNSDWRKNLQGYAEFAAELLNSKHPLY